jgi:hypothetical protein
VAGTYRNSQWVRETRLALMSNGHFDDAEALRLLVRTRAEEAARLRGLAQASDIRFDGASASPARGDEIYELVRSFMRRDAPVLPGADPWRAPPKLPPPWLPIDRAELLLPALRVELERRAILSRLSDDKRRQICAAAEVIWVSYYAHKHPTRLERGGPRDPGHPDDVVGITRVRIRGAAEAHALAVAGKTLGAMRTFYGKPRFVLTGSLVRFFTDVTVSVEKQCELWKRFEVRR